MKIDVFETNLLWDELRKKVNITESFLFRDRVTEPWVVCTEIKFGDGVDIGSE